MTEALAAGVWPIRRLCTTTEAWSQVLADAMSPELPQPEFVTGDRLAELCGSQHHQGIAAQMGIFPYQALDELETLLVHPIASELAPLVVVCDRIQDGHNLGAILRSCDAMAVSVVILGEHEQVGVTPQVARASAGAVNHVPIVRAEPLSDAVSVLKVAGFQVLAASEKSTMPVWEIDASRPSALIVGSEARGVSDVLAVECDQHVGIPMLGAVGSLNAAVAAGMLLYELRRGIVPG